MIQSPLDVLKLSGEAALCTEGGLIRFANQPARSLLGRDVVGMSVRELFGSELASVQAPGFIADFSLGARRQVPISRNANVFQYLVCSD